MQFFYWNKSYEVDIASVDAQHHRLLDLINELSTAISTRFEQPKVAEVLGRLTAYVAEHFSDEEQIMATTTMPMEAQEHHRKEHAIFRNRLSTLIEGTELHDRQTASRILEFLTTWLITHILRSDKELAGYYHATGTQDSTEPEPLQISEVEHTLLLALNDSERRFRYLSDHAPVMIWVSDHQGRRTYYNQAWSLFSGKPELPDDAWRELIHTDDLAAYQQLINQALITQQDVDVEYRARSKDGSYRYFLERILPRMEENGTFMGLIASATDITNLKRAEVLLIQANEELEQRVAERTQQLLKLMHTDPLTQVGNRRMLVATLEEEILRAKRYGHGLSLIFVDLDHFKGVNDQYGHDVGDQVLITTVEIIQQRLRECDQIARYGGEEFVILLPEASIEGARLVAERMCEQIRHHIHPILERPVTCSAGVATWRGGEGSEQLLKRGDNGLYAAKQTGRDRVERG